MGEWTYQMTIYHVNQQLKEKLTLTEVNIVNSKGETNVINRFPGHNTKTDPLEKERQNKDRIKTD